MTGGGKRPAGAPFSGKPLKDSGCVSQRLSGQNVLERQKSSRDFLPVLIIFNDNCSRVSPQGMAFEMPEPYEVKVSSTVLRGLGAGNSSRLPDQQRWIYERYFKRKGSGIFRLGIDRMDMLDSRLGVGHTVYQMVYRSVRCAGISVPCLVIRHVVSLVGVDDEPHRWRDLLRRKSGANAS